MMTNEELVDQYQNGNKAVFEQLLESNKGIIGSFIKKWWFMVENHTMTADDLNAECQYAFLLAVIKYQQDRNCSFASYAFNLINWWLIKTNKRLSIPNRVVSLSDHIPEKENFTYEDVIADPDSEEGYNQISERASKELLKQRLSTLLESICTQQEISILSKRYGINTKQQTLRQIADSLEISISRVQRIESDALKKLKGSLYKDQLLGEFKLHPER